MARDLKYMNWYFSMQVCTGLRKTVHSPTFFGGMPNGTCLSLTGAFGTVKVA